MKTDDFDYYLPEELIAQVPILKRDSSRLMVLDKNTGEVLDFYENIAEAGRENYLSRETIRQCVRGKQKTAGGFKWQIDKEFLKG